MLPPNHVWFVVAQQKVSQYQQEATLWAQVPHSPVRAVLARRVRRIADWLEPAPVAQETAYPQDKLRSLV